LLGVERAGGRAVREGKYRKIVKPRSLSVVPTNFRFDWHKATKPWPDTTEISGSLIKFPIQELNDQPLQGTKTLTD
jgi:hypothetical protein